jgi:hypothetical protein
MIIFLVQEIRNPNSFYARYDKQSELWIVHPQSWTIRRDNFGAQETLVLLHEDLVRLFRVLPY